MTIYIVTFSHHANAYDLHALSDVPFMNISLRIVPSIPRYIYINSLKIISEKSNYNLGYAVQSDGHENVTNN